MSGWLAMVIKLGIVALFASFFICKMTRKAAVRILLKLLIAGGILGGAYFIGSRFMGRKFILIEFGLAFHLLFLMLVFRCISRLVFLRRVQRDGATTAATVTEVRNSRKSLAKLAYEVDGTSYQYNTEWHPNDWKPGDKGIPLRYMPQHPEKACVLPYDLSGTIFLLIVTILLESGMIYASVQLSMAAF